MRFNFARSSPVGGGVEGVCEVVEGGGKRELFGKRVWADCSEEGRNVGRVQDIGVDELVEIPACGEGEQLAC